MTTSQRTITTSPGATSSASGVREQDLLSERVPQCVNSSKCAITSSTETTSPYFASMSYRFASCAAGFRSPTASRGTTGR
jgi:hypothetical protein